MKNSIILILIFISFGSLYAQIEKCDSLSNIISHDIILGGQDTVITTYHINDQDSGYGNLKSSAACGDCDTIVGDMKKQRTVYFLHGLGGNKSSWSAVSGYYNKDLKNYNLTGDKQYCYFDYLADYSLSATNFNAQTTLTTASAHLNQDLHGSCQNIYSWDNNRLAFCGDSAIAIAHSLGGIVGRDLDAKWHANLFGKRKYDGLVTFGSPHHGAKIATSIDEISSFADLLCKNVGGYWAVNEVSLFEMDNTLLTLLGFPISTKVDALTDKVCTMFADSILPWTLRDKNVGLNRQIGYESNYITDTLNQFPVNPDLAKALFYGVEEAPVFWRQMTYMIRDAYEFPPNTIDDSYDQKTVDEVNKVIQTFMSDKVSHVLNYQKYSRNAKWAIAAMVPSIFVTPKAVALAAVIHHQNKLKAAKSLELSHKAGMAFQTMLHSNIYWNQIIGAYRYEDSVISQCHLRIELVHPTLGTFSPPLVKYLEISEEECDCGIFMLRLQILAPAFSASICSAQMEYDTIKVLKLLPSDGTVLVESQKAWKGAPIQFHNKMDKTNHIEMRNNKETIDALYLIFNGDVLNGVPEFFYLDRF